MPAPARGHAGTAGRDGRRRPLRAGAGAVPGRRLPGGRPPRAHATPGSSTRRSRARRASGWSSRAAATRSRSSCATARSTSAPARTCSTSATPETHERRRVRRADVEGMAALCEKLPNIDFVMSMGLPEDAPREIDDLVQVVAMLRGTRKPILVAPRDGSVLARMQEMAALCGEKESFAIYAMPSPPLMHDPDALTKVIGCAELPDSSHLRPGAVHGRHRPAEHRRRRARRQRGDAQRPRAAPARQVAERRSSTASESARWTCAS